MFLFSVLKSYKNHCVCVCLFFYAWVCMPVSEDIKQQIEHFNLRGNVCKYLLADSGPLSKDVVVGLCTFVCVCILCWSCLSGAWSLNSAAQVAFVTCMHAFPVHMCTLESEEGTNSSEYSFDTKNTCALQ